MYLVIAGCKLLSNRVINISKGSQEARLKALYVIFHLGWKALPKVTGIMIYNGPFPFDQSDVDYDRKYP